MISNISQVSQGEAIDKLARIGFITRGIVYGTIGVFAARLALGFGGKTMDQSGAIRYLSQQPFGKFLLALLFVGFAGYALWRFVQAYNNFKINDTKKKLEAAKSALMGIVNAGLSYGALNILMSKSQGNTSTQTMTSKLMSQPMGLWLVGLVGLAFIGTGVYQFYKAYKEKFKDDLMTEKMDAKELAITDKLAKAGLTSRGISFAIIGYFLIQAAINHNPAQSKGLGQALSVLISQPFGTFMLAIVAIGFIAYAGFSFVNAKYNKVEVY